MIMMMLMMNNYTPGLIDAHEFISLFAGSTKAWLAYESTVRLWNIHLRLHPYSVTISI